MRKLSLLLGLFLLLGLSGCSSIPIGSIAPLMRLDLATTNVDALRVALQLPNGLRSRSGGVVMDIVLKVAGLPDQTDQFLLVETHGAAELADLSSMQREGFSLTAYELAATDALQFRAVQAELVDARSRGQQGSLGFGIAAREFCLTGPSAPQRLVASTYLKTVETQGWLTVTDQFDLGADKTIAAGLAHLGPC